MTVFDFILGIKRVDDKCYDTFSPYYAARQKNYAYPLFYQSVTQMIAENKFFYKIFKIKGDSVLAIFKRSTIMGNYSVMLHIAPISLGNILSNEIEIMQNARRLGISIKLCSDDITRYRIPQSLCEPIKGNIEYIYDAKECYEMKGSKFHNYRKKVRKITNMPEYRYTRGVSDNIDRLVAKWDTHNQEQRIKSQQTRQLSDWKNIKKINSNKVVVHNIYVGNTLECFSVIEELSPKHWVLVFGMRNYDSALNDVNVCMHYLDCQVATSDAMKQVYANLGASLGIDGLTAAKEKLKPCAKRQIYRLAPINKLDVSKIKSLFL